MSQLSPAKILIVDDHPMVRDGLTTWISRRDDMEVCGAAADVNEALAEVDRLEPDLVVVDISLPSGNGVDLIKQIRARNNHVKMLVSSMYDESLYAERALRAGAAGYINKQEAPEKVIEAISMVLDGEIYLSPAMTSVVVQGSLRGRTVGLPTDHLTDRELEIFELIGRGMTTSQIAERLSLSVHTIDTHRTNIRTKLKLENAAELTRHAVKWVLDNG